MHYYTTRVSVFSNERVLRLTDVWQKMCALAETTAGSLSNAFLAEIREILRVPLRGQVLTTQIASFQLLSLALFTDDLIEEALSYQEKANQLANELNVEFASRFEGNIESEYAQSVQYTLWGTFATSLCVLFRALQSSQAMR